MLYIVHKWEYFSSFEAGNCFSNSSFKRMKNRNKTFSSVRVKHFFIVLGHRRHSRVTHSLSLGRPTDTAMPPGKSCRDESRQQLTSLLNHFDDAACYMAVNMGWEGGIHAQTCGHYLHLDCQKSYLQSLQVRICQLFFSIHTILFNC